MSIYEILSYYRSEHQTQREKGTYFENLIEVFLKYDERFSDQFSKIQTYSNWANAQNIDAKDIGIDLVATNKDNTLSAIQCKFYSEDHTISKSDIDSFFSASDSNKFTRRILVDSTRKGLGTNTLKTIENSSKIFTRISMDELESSSIKWETFYKTGKVEKSAKKVSRPHQIEAINNTIAGFKSADRGKLFMACGTGKTFTALNIAEKFAGANKNVLFLVPSLALMSQTVTDWVIETNIGINAYSVCSDTNIGKNKSEDSLGVTTHDLAYPATTNAKTLAEKFSIADKDKMNVVFATYQSLAVIEEAQKEYDLPEFDLVICDEAHRTTGARYDGDDESTFVKIHSNENIKAKYRLYMTATPRIYGETAKNKAEEIKAEVYSMDDVTKYGEVFYSIKFGEAVDLGLLTDYKVMILTIDEAKVAKDVQQRLADEDNQLQLDDATKMIGCYKALIKEEISNKIPMKRAVAFCKSIKASKQFTDEFANVCNEFLTHNPHTLHIDCETDHIDGTMNATQKGAKLSWLKENTEDKCRILSNARCLSEGVDVPSLDAVMFIHGRKSMVDIVQSVGRVMRRAPNKELGYIIIPVGIPQGQEASSALANSKDYNVVWDIINALRSHDERLDSSINKVALTDDPASKLQAIRDKIEIIATIEDLPARYESNSRSIGMGSGTEEYERNIHNEMQHQMAIALSNDSVQQGILAKLVDKCGTRTYWEDWASDISEIAQKHITRIQAVLSNKESEAYKKFQEFVNSLKSNTNDAVTEEEVIEMLAQHIITQPVFEALFEGYNFSANNSMSKSMQAMLDILDKENINKESQELDKFFTTVKKRVAGVDTAEAKQKIIVELYDKFFRNAFPRLTERLGIVYTPVECVDFIIHSVNDVLKAEFGQELGDKNTHIIDPFTGTGTFITRLMQSGLLTKEQLEYKYNLRDKQINGEKIKTTEIHANELVLLAYYIASVNIEAVYQSIVGGQYKSFEGICLTDTFQLAEAEEDLITPQLADNNHRRKIQKKLPIRVFIGNPPYSAGQSSGNDNNQNVKYKNLDKSIEETYVKHSNAGLSKSAYDSYIRAIKWASDRIDKYGVIGFITNAGWIESASSDGMRKCLKDEFSSIYIFHLRGNARTSGELRRQEKDNVFGQGTRTPIAISILVKNPDAKEHGKIYFHDIGDYLSREEKLDKIAELGSISNITKDNLWQEIQPDKYNDWINQRDDSYYDYIPLGSKDKKFTGIKIFNNFSLGLATNRDAWVYNYSKSKLESNVSSMIDFYNTELERYKASSEIIEQPKKLIDAEKFVAEFVTNNSKQIAWSRDYRYDLCRGDVKKINTNKLVNSIYRPYTKTSCFYDDKIAMELYQLPKIFPENGVDNIVIGVTSLGAKKGFYTLISNVIFDLNSLEAGNQCFPLYLYEAYEDKQVASGDTEDMIGYDNQNNNIIITATSGQKYKRTAAITDEGLAHFTSFYKDTTITKEDLFYYIYGLLHSPEYREKYKDNLTKALPHIPRVKRLEDFIAFSTSGRALSDLHINYESKPMYNATFNADTDNLNAEDFYVTKMKFIKKGQQDTIVYNNKITISDIPLEAYDYVVNGKSAIEWVMERQGVSTHKDSGIVNDANDWAIETMNNAKYPLELLQRVITVSLETQKIVRELPKLGDLS